ncbi:MAG TPA: sigma-70 family RNA polymerase sigma factor [Steroidobacteraceae bacterium]|nr:sigma-70 family RNA polymerase sigma factor [Steroidobacteraceae bacterium]
MDAAISDPMSQDRQLAAAVLRERDRVLAFIRRRIDDAAEAEDILQDALYELVAAARLAQPVEQVGAWLMRVARNRIIDRFRRKRPELLLDAAGADEDVEELLPAADGTPETAAMRALLLAEIEAALAELPREQREVFVAQELEGLTFRELAERSGVSINTLLSRKRYAVRQLRERLQSVYEDWLAE